MAKAGFSVPGFSVERMLGFDAAGERWLARDEATGERVCLRRLSAGRAGGPTDEAAVRRTVRLLRRVSDPHVVPVRRIVSAGSELVLVQDHPPGPTLAGLLASRRRLAPGEVVTIGVAVARALGCLHAADLIHGRVETRSVVLGEDTLPRLDLGWSAELSPGVDPHGSVGSRTAADDVSALCRLLAGALLAPRPASGPAGQVGAALAASGAPPALVDVLVAGLATDPAGRPTAAGFAHRLGAAAPAAALDGVPMGGPAPRSHRVPHAERQERTGPTGRHRRSTAPLRSARRVGRRTARRTARLAATAGMLAIALCLLAALVGVAAIRFEAHQQTPTLPPTPTASAVVERGTGWVGVLDRLERRRRLAYATGDAASLDTVYAAGSAALAEERRRLQLLARAGVRARGLRLDVRAAHEVADFAGRVDLRVTDRLPSYRLVDATGAVVRRVPGRGGATWRLSLIRAGPRDWRIAAVSGKER